MQQRTAKRLLIIFIYLILLGVVVLVTYNAIKPEETCTDKIKNQNEEDMDCGGVCAKCDKISALDLAVSDKGLVENGRPGEYDGWALVSNPNNLFGAKYFEYEIILKNSEGAVISQKNGTSFILPGEKKYIVENNLSSESVFSEMELNIKKTEWVKFEDYYEKPSLKVVNKNYSQISSGVGFSEASGLLKNESPYDFNVIRIYAILKNSEGKILALNSTEMRTVKSGEERDFKVLWMGRFPGEVANFEAQAEVNIFESEAFIRKISSLEK